MKKARVIKAARRLLARAERHRVEATRSGNFLTLSLALREWNAGRKLLIAALS